MRLRFVPKPDRDSAALRDGSVDLEAGVVAQALGPELRTQALFRDRFVGVVRKGHALCRGQDNSGALRRRAACRRSAAGTGQGPIDDALAEIGMERQVAAIVGGYSGALALARTSDLVASVPERHTGLLRAGLHSFPLPIPIPMITISLMLWHPRQDADQAHRWLRTRVRDVLAS